MVHFQVERIMRFVMGAVAAPYAIKVAILLLGLIVCGLD